ncbi:competence/damage-inducible protein A [Natrinema longum]|uniref:Competence/damage-inducible protein A n=1 Tax=Natrinema longum TaxID=370324 RepID=A0A8A2U7T1_9EURY|nr:molybdopterin-binding protein [Natrinema longum]MBZ6494688.1 competence/damage-inducible protein A [Natrinema longum]QSW83998.1 competence/damage-inducible protein A [Natrinema longum]
MEVALLTVGDELLSGDTVNTNANWVATQLTDRGVTVTRIVSVPDDHDVIVDHVRRYSEAFDGVIVTGGIGGTPDDVTMEAVAAAFDRELRVPDVTRSAVERHLDALEERLPDRELSVDVAAEAAIPERSRPLLNDAGLAPGCVLENVYVLPGIPDELKSMFATVADEFTGDRRSTFLYTIEPEANIVWALEDVMDRFEVTVGCYPDREAEHNRLKITATDDAQLDGARDWLVDTINASETPVSRDWGGDDSETETS